MQCTRCGYLKNGLVSLKECPGGKHQFRSLPATLLAKALGSFGGSPPRYATEEERRAARLKTFADSNAKRRGKIAEAAEAT
jgi:hypothetical protein